RLKSRRGSSRGRGCRKARRADELVRRPSLGARQAGRIAPLVSPPAVPAGADRCVAIAACRRQGRTRAVCPRPAVALGWRQVARRVAGLPTVRRAGARTPAELDRHHERPTVRHTAGALTLLAPTERTIPADSPGRTSHLILEGAANYP